MNSLSFELFKLILLMQFCQKREMDCAKQYKNTNLSQIFFKILLFYQSMLKCIRWLWPRCDWVKSKYLLASLRHYCAICSLRRSGG